MSDYAASIVRSVMVILGLVAFFWLVGAVAFLAIKVL